MKADVLVSIDWQRKAAFVRYETSVPLDEVVDDAEDFPNGFIAYIDEFVPEVLRVFEYGKFAGPKDLAKTIQRRLEKEGYRTQIKVDMTWSFL